MKPKLLYMAAIISALMLNACRAYDSPLQNPNDLTPTTLTEQFDLFCDGMRQSYVFWAYDDTNWDEVQQRLRPRFQELDGKKEVKAEELRALYLEASRTLIDHHLHIRIVNLKAASQSQAVISLYPGVEEAKTRDYYHTTLPREYFTASLDALEASGRLTQRHRGLGRAPGGDIAQLECGIVDGDILYFRLSAFALFDIVNSNPEFSDDTYDNPAVIEALRFFQQTVVERGTELAGVIVDVRSNGGGYTDDIPLTLSYLIPEPVRIGYTRAKSGLHPLDYGKWMAFDAYPASHGTLPADVPVVALCDVASISMAELTTHAIAALPNGIAVGERTFGATGPRTHDYQMLYTGPFTSRDGSVQITCSSWQHLLGEKRELLEGKGVTPDVWIPFDADSETDTQLLETLKLIRTL